MSWQHATPSTLQFLLGLTSGKTDRLDKDLEKVWTAHLVVAGIGIAMVLNIGKVTESLFSHLVGSYDPKTAAAILLAISLYYFMKIGPLLTAFNEAKKLRDELLEAYLTGQPQEGMATPLRRPTSFLAAAFYPGGVPDFIVTALVVSLAQAAPLFLVVKAYQASATISLVIALSFMAILYTLFWRTRRENPRASWAVSVLCVLVPFWFFLFEFLIPG